MTRIKKNSGVEWIGEIPKDWDLIKLKWLLQSPLQYGANESGGVYDEELPRYIRITDISPNGQLKENNKLSLPLEKSQEYLLNEGDVLFARSGSVEKSFLYHDSYGRSAFAGYLIRAKPNQEELLSEFLYYYTQSTNYEEWQSQIFIQVTIQNIDAEKYSQLILIVPPLSEQNHIISYLDKKCFYLDSTIEKEREVIDKLKEYRQAVITESVTKGIRAGVPMKDSGVEWIGEIPEGWGIIPLKYTVKCNLQVLSEKTDQDTQISYIDIGSVSSDGNISEVQTLSFKEAPSRARRIVFENDTIVSTVRTYLKAIAFISKSYENFIVSTGFAVLSPQKQYNPRYFYYALRADWFISLIESNSVGISYPAINSEKLISLQNIVPPVSEQQEIADYLDAKCSAIDATIQKRELAIEKLTAYKQSLISEYVTGKKDVLA